MNGRKRWKLDGSVLELLDGLICTILLIHELIGLPTQIVEHVPELGI